MFDPAGAQRRWNELSLACKRILVHDTLNSIVVLPTSQRARAFDVSGRVFELSHYRSAECHHTVTLR